MNDRFSEHHIEVIRTARYWTLGPEEGAREVWYGLHGYRQLGRRFLRRFEPIDDGTRLVVAPDALSRFYVSSGSGRHGAESVVGGTWMTRDDRDAEIRDYVRYLDRLARKVGATGSAIATGSDGEARDAGGADPGAADPGAAYRRGLAGGSGPEAGAPTVTVLGFSQGVATACRWVALGDVRPDRLLLWGDVSPPDLDLERAAERFAGIDVILVRGSDDRALAPHLVEQEAERLASASIDYQVVRYEGGHDIDADTLVALAGSG